MKKESHEAYILTSDEFSRLVKQAPEAYDTLMEDQDSVLVHLQKTSVAKPGIPQSISYLIMFSNPNAEKQFEEFCMQANPPVEIHPSKP